MVKKFEEFAALLYLLPFHCSVFGFIQDYPINVIGVCIVYSVIDCPVDKVVLVIAVGHPERNPSADQSKTRRGNPAVLDELVYDYSIPHIVRVFVGVKVPRLRAIVVMYQTPSFLLSPFFTLLADKLFLYKQSF